MTVFGLGDLAFMGAATGGYVPVDSNAAAYIAAVEAADGYALEPGIRQAIDNFVIGCKADGIWNAIKASCILAGARTLAGALVPLVGAAPTNFNFVTGDYNRKTGLIGNGSTKYLNSNRNNNADPQNNCHLSVYLGGGAAVASTEMLIGCRASDNIHDIYISSANSLTGRSKVNNSGNITTINVVSPGQDAGFAGHSRTASTSTSFRFLGASQTSSFASTSFSADLHVFRRNDLSGANSFLHTSTRLAFYSIGESLNLALLDARVTTLINAFAAAIP